MMPGEFFFGIRPALCRHCGGVFQRSNGNTYFCSAPACQAVRRARLKAKQRRGDAQKRRQAK